VSEPADATPKGKSVASLFGSGGIFDELGRERLTEERGGRIEAGVFRRTRAGTVFVSCRTRYSEPVFSPRLIFNRRMIFSRLA
jgi:hypothetical protein